MKNQSKGGYEMEHNVKEMYDNYLNGATFHDLGMKYSITGQRIHQLFQQHNLPRRIRKPRRSIKFKGDLFSENNKQYFQRTTGDRKYLHTAVWEAAHGKKPIGYEVHHKDRNRQNNLIDNLQLVKSEDHKCFERLPYDKRNFRKYKGWFFDRRGIND